MACFFLTGGLDGEILHLTKGVKGFSVEAVTDVPHHETVIAQMFCTDFDAADYHTMPITRTEEDAEGPRRQNKNMFFPKGHAEMSGATKITICQNFSTLVF